MARSWPDLEGVTRAGAHKRLPRIPDRAAALLAAACELPAVTREALVAEAVARGGGDRVRYEGLAAWLPSSHVARWDPDDGTLRLHPGTSGWDLALRYGAWVGSQPIAEEDVEAVTAYARAVVAAVGDARTTVGDRPGHPWLADDGEVPARGGVPDALTARIGRLLAALDAAYLERSSHVRAVLLAMLAGRHALLLGPPGTAKSALARGLASCFRDARYFEYLLSRFTHPDELFGPISIPGLKQEDYRRLTEGFLPSAHIAFLDEIFKANSAILNSLLTLINERIFHHGRHRDPVPLIGMVGASNELPDPEGGLEALFDRFLVRMTVPPLAEAEAFLAVATGTVPVVDIAAADALTVEEVLALRTRAGRVEVPDLVRDALVELWHRAAEAEWAVSDRRWRQAVDLLKVGAAAEGRRRLVLLDLLMLEHVLPVDPRAPGDVRDVLVETVAPRTVPEHDLRAQWTLLRLDRVAPAAHESLDDGAVVSFEDRLARRRRHARRMVARIEEAVEELALDRQRLEGRSTRLWQGRLPPRILAAHLEMGREVARVLQSAEQYLGSLHDMHGVAHAMLQSLPEPVRAQFASAGVALRLVLEDGTELGITLAGERVERPATREAARPVQQQGRLSRPPASRQRFEVEAFERAPVLHLTPRALVEFVRSELDTEVLLGQLDPSSARQAQGVLERVRRHLGSSGVPAPPRWPSRA